MGNETERSMITRTLLFGAFARGGAWSVRLAALLTGLMGVINVLSAVTPSLPARLTILRHVLPLEVRYGSHLAATLAGFALLVLAQSLWRRKRAAWLLTLLILIASAVSHLLKGLDWEEALVAVGLASWLFFPRAQFYARSDRPSVRQGVGIVAGAVLFTLAYGVVGLYLLDKQFRVNFGLAAALRQTLAMFFQFRNPGLDPVTGFGRHFADSIYVVAASTLGYALFCLVRPIVLRERASSSERERARAIVEAYGRSSLARMVLFEDVPAYCFSPGGSVIAFTVEGRTAVTLGDPIGPTSDAAAAILLFRDFCARRDWAPAFCAILPDHLPHYRAAGFDVLCIGHEAIVDLESFGLTGGANKGLRSNVNRLVRDGHRAELHEPPLAEDLLAELRAVSDEWLATRHGKEMHFWLGWFDDAYIRGSRVMALYTPEGAISAFVNIIPEYQIPECSIDLMRHRKDVASGTMDLLFVRLFEWAKQEGYQTFNLGLSPLSGVGERREDPAGERAVHFLYERLNRLYNFQGLHTFKSKFHPRWSPLYLAYPGAASLPAVTLAILRADAGDRPVWNLVR